VEIQLNGAPYAVASGVSVRALLALLGLDRPGVAVAVDNRVIARSLHAETLLAPGAKVEVIQAVGGG
jgi:sulfur carrier protein